MKCIHCNSDSKLRDRNASGGKCVACGHKFAFEPSTDVFKITDPSFLAMASRVSEKGTLKFTARQLYYEFCRHLDAKAPKGCAMAGAGVVLLALMGGAAGTAHHFGADAKVLPATTAVSALTALLMFAAVAGNKNKKAKPEKYARIAFSDFNTRYLSVWESTHGPVEGLLPPVQILRATAGNSALPPAELAAFSFDRALIVDSGEIAHSLVANRFHFENNCAILSADRRYPAGGTFEQVLSMLRRNPNLVVFALHDASIDGATLPIKLRAADWFPEPSVRIVSLGLRPADVAGRGMILQKLAAPSGPIAGESVAWFTDDEQAWLSEGNVGELSAIRPARLMKTIYAGFARAAQTADDGWYVGPGGIYIWNDPYPMMWAGGGYADGAAFDASAPDSFG